MEADMRKEIRCVLADVFMASRQMPKSITRTLTDGMSSSVLAGVIELLSCTSSGGAGDCSDT